MQSTMHAQRINITGNAGAGKTTLAAALGERLGLPVSSLDSVVWQPGWRKTEPQQRRQAELALIARPAWVIDGVSTLVREAADLVVLLDAPRHVCLWRCAKRNWRYAFRSRPGLPKGCPEWQMVARLTGIIWRFPRGPGASIMLEAEAHPYRYRVVPADAGGGNGAEALAERIYHDIVG
jgi:adenylate kinase family enzyme